MMHSENYDINWHQKFKLWVLGLICVILVNILEMVYIIMLAKKKKLKNYVKDLKNICKAKLERNYYNKNTKLAEEQRKLVNQKYSKGKTQYCSIDATAHYSYDWAQNVHVPHLDQQVSKIYYLSISTTWSTQSTLVFL